MNNEFLCFFRKDRLCNFFFISSHLQSGVLHQIVQEIFFYEQYAFATVLSTLEPRKF